MAITISSNLPTPNVESASMATITASAQILHLDITSHSTMESKIIVSHPIEIGPNPLPEPTVTNLEEAQGVARLSSKLVTDPISIMDMSIVIPNTKTRGIKG
ncbi:MAG: hypothetical protein KDD45_05610 [Bdellovibrionales bacterium]|nr:hypothetical protein [Bdellovibrionales bacterium]